MIPQVAYWWGKLHVACWLNPPMSCQCGTFTSMSHYLSFYNSSHGGRQSGRQRCVRPSCWTKSIHNIREILRNPHTTFQVSCCKRNDEGSNEAWQKETNMAFKVHMYMASNSGSPILLPRAHFASQSLGFLIWKWGNQQASQRCYEH